MAQEKDPTLDPSTPSGNYSYMLNSWNKIQTVLDGTEAMRMAGNRYLPMHQNESSINYEERKSRATLLNLTALTLDQWVGKPFADPVNVGEDVPDELQEWLKDIDLQRNDVSTFSREWLREGLAKSFSHVLVDAPADVGERITLADDVGARPFWNFIRPENLFAAESRMVDGQEVLVHARIFEQETVREGFAEVTIDRIRAFDRVLPGASALSLPGIEQAFDLNELAKMDDPVAAAMPFESGVWVTVFRKEEKEQGEVEWVVEQPPQRLDERMDEIPIVSFYASRKDLLKGKSPIEDLVDLNINWWQSNSDQNIVLTMARFPLLALSGGDEDECIVEVGPKKMLFTPDPQGKFYYVEHSGAAINSGQKHLDKLEEQMAHYGAEFLKRRPGNTTATERALDSAEATSPLQDAAMRFNEALNQALRLTGKWVGIEETGRIEVATDFEEVEKDSAHLDFLDKARGRGDLSKQNYLEEARRRGALREDFDMEENEQQLEEERTEMGLDGGGEDIDDQAEE
jgi:hypothetical protein